jgi:pimeloyl-ACP methyl ester carboxylesterase
MTNNWIFIHGGWGGSWQWSPLQDYLKSRNIISFAPTMPGMGGENGSQITLDNFVDFVAKIIDEQNQQINLAAFSFGGMTATALAGKIPEN